MSIKRSLNSIDTALQQQQQRLKQLEYERKKERLLNSEKKQDLELYKLELYNYLYDKFTKKLSISADFIADFELLETKNQIFKDFMENISYYTGLKKNEPFKLDLLIYYNNLYYKLLNYSYKEAEKNEKIKYLTIESEKPQKKKIDVKLIILILFIIPFIILFQLSKILAIIIFLTVLLIGAFI